MNTFRLIAACAALLTGAAVAGQSLTLANLKGPIARAGGTAEARSIAELWRQVNALVPTAAAPAPGPSPEPSPAPSVAAPTVPNRAALLVPAAVPPGSPPPEEIGNFRFICTAGPMNWDDAILYPGRIGGSPHLHQNYGNTLIDGNSTHESLVAAGESTCSNALNRSAYWVPALMTGDGRNTIRPDWINIYYKRLPASSPTCRKMAPKGCVGIPRGLRVVSGFDMKRMHDKQPENLTFSHRCATDGKPSNHRALLAEAIADCGGSGEIVSAISFGDCWNGQLDSPDHRSHLTFPRWDQGASGTPWPGPCPRSHPYLIPQLSQLLQYTIAPGDGAVYFASDRMNGMDMAPGSTFHADYIEGWDEQTRLTWEAHCLDRKLNCSDGVLGDGTMLKRPVLTYKADPRLMPVPARPGPD